MRIKTTLRINNSIILVIAGLLIMSLVWAYKETVKANENESFAIDMQNIAYKRTELRDEYLFRQEERARFQWIEQTDQFKKLIAMAGGKFTSLSDQAILANIEREFSTNMFRFSELVEYRKNKSDAKRQYRDIGENRMISQIIVSAYDLNSSIDKLRESTSAAAHVAQERTVMIIIVLLIISVIISFGNSGFINGVIARRIRELNKGSELFGAGNFDHRIPISGNDELTDLSISTNEMVEKLSKSYTSIANLQKEINERKQIEETLQKSEERNRTILQTAMDGFWLVDLQGRLLEVNETYCRMSGYSLQELLTMHIPDLEAVETSHDTSDHLQKVVGQGEGRFESRHRRKDGSIFDVEISVQYRSSEGGRIVAFLHDITERKQIEEVQAYLAQTSAGTGDEQFFERLARFLAQSLGMDFVCIDRLEGDGLTARTVAIWHDGNFEDNMTYALKDTPCGNVVGKAVCCFPANVCQFFPRDQVLQDMRAESYVGVTLWSHTGQPIGLIAVIGRNPLVNRRLAETMLEMVAVRAAGELQRLEAVEALRESERRVTAMLQAIPDLMFRMNSQGVFLDYKADERDLYVKSVPIIGKRNRDITPPEFADLIDRQIRTALETRAMQTFEYQLPIPSHGLHCYEARMIAITTDEVMAIVRDVTMQKQTEEEKRSLTERLQRTEKMEALGQLAGGVAHDLNNVLGVSTIYSELLQEKLPEGNPLRSYADKILSSNEKAAAIIQDLLTLARRGVTVSDVTNLNTIIANFLKTPEFEKIQTFHPNVTFRTHGDGELMNIKGSPVHLEKTLMNLVSNAAEAISSKGEVTIRTENRYLDTPLRGYDDVKEGDYAVLTISDTGMGIPAENVEKIFEPFYTKKTMGRSGTGLGLAIVWGTVKDHNGYIDVQTEVGEGTTFTLYFPVTREEMIAPQQKVPIERYMGKGESVLVVDDIAEQREIAGNLLTRLGYQVHMVSGGEEAVEYLKANHADILVLDMIMTPGIDGLETYERVLEINPKQKAIIVSGFSETDRVKEAQRLGAGTYVKKPYVMEKIGMAIRDELDRK